jgi:hypothetical protein
VSRLDVDLRPLLWSALAIAATVSGAIALIFVLLRAWHEPPGGAASGAATLVPALRALGPTLQSAPQFDAAAKPAAVAASQVAR